MPREDLPLNTVIHGDCLEEMQKLEENSIDAIVTDPPYGIYFMNRNWDEFSPQEYQQFSQTWATEALRILKPGAYLAAFSSPKTYHRMVTGLEDAGLLIRDCIMYLYGNGFPKNYNISKAIDKYFDKTDEREVVGNVKNTYDGSTRDPDKHSNPANDSSFGEWGLKNTPHGQKHTQGATDLAKKYDGYGTALKPSYEPIALCQKPRNGTYVENILNHGTGPLNIDATRIPTNPTDDGVTRARKTGTTDTVGNFGFHNKNQGKHTPPGNKGRWPANTILDPHAAHHLNKQTGNRKAGGTPKKRNSDKFRNTYGDFTGHRTEKPGIGPSQGGASRFFYTAKASKKERHAGLNDSIKNDHPTLKPLTLTRYLVRLITPPNGVVLDPFAGSGTTACAATIENYNYILIEKRQKYAKTIAPQRIKHWNNPDNWTELKHHNELPDEKELKDSSIEI